MQAGEQARQRVDEAARSSRTSPPTHTPSPVRDGHDSSTSSTPDAHARSNNNNANTTADTTRAGAFTVTASNTTPAATTRAYNTARPRAAATSSSTRATTTTTTTQHTLNPAAKEFQLPANSSVVAAAAAASLYAMPLSHATTATALHPYAAAAPLPAGLSTTTAAAAAAMAAGAGSMLLTSAHPSLLAATQPSLQQQPSLYVPATAAMLPCFMPAAATTASTASTPLLPASSTTASDFTSTWNSALGSGRGGVTPTSLTTPSTPHAATNTATAAAAMMTTTTAAPAHHGGNVFALDEAAMQAQYIEYIQATCLRRPLRNAHAAAVPPLHVVAVLHLDASTTSAQLAALFFPMGASDATVLEPRYLPYQLAQHSQLTHQRAGVVFFASRDCALFGVEKMHQFRPIGQHNTLAAFYCGPDALDEAASQHTATTSSTATTTAMTTMSLPAASASTTTTSSNNDNNNSTLSRGGALPWVLPDEALTAVHEAMYAVFQRSNSASNNSNGSNSNSTHALVAVHGLDEYVANDVLCRMAARTGAVGCEVWSPSSRSPRGHVSYASNNNNNTTTATARRCMSVSAMLVYRSERDAQLAVTLLDHTTPAGQRWPVHVVYLSPAAMATAAAAASTTSLASSATTTAAHEHGDTHARTRSPPLPSPPRALQQPQPTATAAVTLVPDSAAVYDEIDRYFLAKYTDPSQHLVGVHNLTEQTNKAMLYKIFYPLGARDTDVAERVVLVNHKPRRSGVAIFDSACMAQEAMKINQFVPPGQSRPLIVRYLHRTPPPATTTTTITTTTEAAATTALLPAMTCGNGASTPRGHTDTQAAQQRQETQPHAAVVAHNDDDDDDDDEVTLARRLRVVEEQLCDVGVEQHALAAAMCRYVQHAIAMLQRQQHDSATTTAAATPRPHNATTPQQQLAELLVSVLRGRRHHAMAIASLLSGALADLHDTLQLRRRRFSAARDAPGGGDVDNNSNSNSNSSIDAAAGGESGGSSSSDEELRESFARRIAQAMMCLLIDATAPREARLVAAVLSAYSFQFRYMCGSPYAFALRLLRRHADELRATRAYLARDVDATAPATTTATTTATTNATDAAAVEQQHRQWLTLVDALREMTTIWRTHNRTRAKRDADARAVDDFFSTFYGHAATATATTTAATSTPLRATTARSNSRCPSTCDAALDDASPGSARRHAHAATATTTTTAAAALVTPSARPTPRLVITRVSASAGGRGGVGSTPTTTTTTKTAATAAAAMATLSGAPPAIALASPQSDKTPGLSADVSLESSATPHAHAHALVTGHHQTPVATTRRTGNNSNNNNSNNSDGNERTVYVTKLPSCLNAGKVRRLLLHFGDFAKVRLYGDDKDMSSSSSSSRSAHASYAAGAASSNNPYGKLCYGFVEFVDEAAAHAMVEYFRNAVHMPGAFDFLRDHHHHGDNDEATATTLLRFSDEELRLLGSTRASQARSRIHDQNALDADVGDATRLPTAATVTGGDNGSASTTAPCRAQPCQFGLVLPHVAIDVYSDACQRLLCAQKRPSRGASSSSTSHHVASQHSSISQHSSRHRADAVTATPLPLRLAAATTAAAGDDSAGTMLIACGGGNGGGGLFGGAFGDDDDDSRNDASPQTRAADDDDDDKAAATPTRPCHSHAGSINDAVVAATLARLQEQQQQQAAPQLHDEHADPTSVLQWNVANIAIDDSDDSDDDDDASQAQRRQHILPLQSLLGKDGLW